jgi:hypothetical protein
MTASRGSAPTYQYVGKGFYSGFICIFFVFLWRKEAAGARFPDRGASALPEYGAEGVVLVQRRNIKKGFICCWLLVICDGPKAFTNNK